MILQGSEKCLYLSQQIHKRFTESKKSLGTAESCTGGLMASLLTHHVGSSGFYRGGISAYSNDVKMKVLGVSQKTLAEKGAVSMEAATEMASGALSLLNSDYSISITGIAGPSGGTADKPVGTIFVGIATRKEAFAKKFSLGLDRLQNRSEISFLALRELLHYTENLPK